MPVRNKMDELTGRISKESLIKIFKDNGFRVEKKYYRGQGPIEYFIKGENEWGMLERNEDTNEFEIICYDTNSNKVFKELIEKLELKTMLWDWVGGDCTLEQWAKGIRKSIRESKQA